ncbi:MAG: STAS domain-containing protein [Holophaga sp.]|nr:STAS domain-containing protein [Holophaga sp.]
MPANNPSPTDSSTLRIPSGGNLVASTVEGRRKAAMEALAAPCTEAVLDLTESEVVDSLGITLILGLFKTCQQRKIGFRVEGANADLMRVFKLFSLPKLFPIKER